VGSSKILEHSTITWCTNINVDHHLKTCICFCTHERLSLFSADTHWHPCSADMHSSYRAWF
jgi:hypothetical protein